MNDLKNIVSFDIVCPWCWSIWWTRKG